VCCSVLQCVAVCCSVLQCVAICCSVLQCVAVCCSVLQCVAGNECIISQAQRPCNIACVLRVSLCSGRKGIVLTMIFTVSYITFLLHNPTPPDPLFVFHFGLEISGIIDFARCFQVNWHDSSCRGGVQTYRMPFV